MTMVTMTIAVDCVRMLHEGKRQLEVAVRMDSLDEGRPLRCEHSVYVCVTLYFHSRAD